MVFILLLALLGLMGLALVALGAVELVLRARRRGRRTVGVALLAVGMLTLVDLSMWARGFAPYTNRVYRVLAGAPAVRVNGKLLSYQGTFPTSPGYLKPWQESDEGVPLYMVVNPYGIPPWIFIPRTDKDAFRYKYPREMPWRI